MNDGSSNMMYFMTINDFHYSIVKDVYKYMMDNNLCTSFKYNEPQQCISIYNYIRIYIPVMTIMKVFTSNVKLRNNSIYSIGFSWYSRKDYTNPIVLVNIQHECITFKNIREFNQCYRFLSNYFNIDTMVK